MNYPNLERLIEIIDILRSENGCKWDREQTHSSLRKNMLEEAYEAVDAIDDNDLIIFGDIVFYSIENDDIFSYKNIINPTTNNIRYVTYIMDTIDNYLKKNLIKTSNN